MGFLEKPSGGRTIELAALVRFEKVPTWRSMASKCSTISSWWWSSSSSRVSLRLNLPVCSGNFLSRIPAAPPSPRIVTFAWEPSMVNIEGERTVILGVNGLPVPATLGVPGGFSASVEEDCPWVDHWLDLPVVEYVLRTCALTRLFDRRRELLLCSGGWSDTGEASVVSCISEVGWTGVEAGRSWDRGVLWAVRRRGLGAWGLGVAGLPSSLKTSRMLR